LSVGLPDLRCSKVVVRQGRKGVKIGITVNPAAGCHERSFAWAKWLPESC
jgi:hypothetical protein